MRFFHLVSVLAIFLLSRSYGLLGMPPFMDETLYIRWLNIIQQTKDFLYPLKEFGWEPLNIWLAVGLNFLVNNPLLSLRLTAGFFGLLTFLLIFYSRGTITALILLLSPVILLHDRLGLRGDSAIVFLTALCFYGLNRRLIDKKPQAVWLISLSLILGLLTKTTAAVLVFSIILSYLFYKPKLKLSDWLAGLLSFLPLVFYWSVGSLSAVLNKKEVFFGLISSHLIKSNLIQTWFWLWQYLTWPVLLLAVVGLIAGYFYQRSWFKLTLIMLLSPLILVIGFSKIIFPRYLLSVYIILIILAGFGLQKLISFLPKKLASLSLVLLLPATFFTYQLLTNFKSAPLPEIERWQYLTGWPSGYGLAELIAYLKTDPPSVLVTEDNDLIKTGLPYLWPQYPFIITQTATAGAYFVVNINHQLPENVNGELIKEFFRPENKSSIKLFKLL